MVSVTAMSGEGRRETKAPRKRHDASVRGGRIRAQRAWFSVC